MDLVATAALAAVMGWGLPWLSIRMVVGSLREGRTVTNYRGRQVFMGLGVAWLVWAGCAIVSGVAVSVLQGDGQPSVLPVLVLAGPLALTAFALGLVDDAFGTDTSRGFRGHLRAALRGTLTTGGLKLLGISTACFAVALVLAPIAPWAGYQGASAPVLNGALALVAGAAIALTSNFVNLTDLRPGRALKVGSVLTLFGVLSTGLLLPASEVAAAGGAASATAVGRSVDVLALLVFALGPILAVWRYDVRGEGMLGDAGANPMGAVAGLLLVAGLPLWGLVAYLVAILALNLVSERVSFTAVIERTRWLRWLDLLGRSAESSANTGTDGVSHPG